MFTIRAERRSADDMLLVEIGNNNPRGVERYLAEGASINGSVQSGEAYPPVVYAAAVGSPRMIEFLLEKGADVDVAVWRDGDFPKHSRAIHVAIGADTPGAVDALRALLKAGANVDAKNVNGCTALMMACRVTRDAPQCVTMARELLAAGADVNLKDADDRVALHYAAYSGNVELIDMLLSEPSLSTLNHITEDGKTPLLVATEFNHPIVLARLVAAGASQSAALRLSDYQCPFKSSVVAQKEDLVRVLVTSRGMEAVGGGAAVIPGALACVTMRGAAKVLSLVLAADGEQRQAAWANHRAIMDIPVLSLAAGYGILKNVKTLLAAGALETNIGPDGSMARHVVGTLARHGRNAKEEAAIKRELQRGPAYRARSRLWPSETETADADADGGRADAPLGVRIYRRTDPKFSFRTIER